MPAWKENIPAQQRTTQSSTDGIQDSLQKHDRKLSEKYGKSAKENQRGEPRGYNRWLQLSVWEGNDSAGCYSRI